MYRSLKLLEVVVSLELRGMSVDMKRGRGKGRHRPRALLEQSDAQGAALQQAS